MSVHGDAEIVESHNFKRANFNHAGRCSRETAWSYDVHAYARRLADIYQRIAPVAEIRGTA